MPTADRPNLLIVYTDQMRGMDMGCAGNPDLITPTLDRLAAEGVRCTRGYASYRSTAASLRITPCV